MGLTSALNTSLNGLALNETKIDVLGNNIANAGTNGFKASNVLFHTQLSQTLSVGSSPTGNNGGTNPIQIGLGASTASIRKDFSQGSISNTNSPSDLAIQGDGFFVLNGANGVVYSRAGNFTLNSQNKLVSPDGSLVQGYGVDDNFVLNPTQTLDQLEDLEINVGTQLVAQTTTTVEIDGNLTPTGTGAPTNGGAQIFSAGLFTTAGGGAGAALTTPLDELSLTGAASSELFETTDVISFTPRKGNRILEPQTLAVDGATVADLVALMSDVYGIFSESEYSDSIPQHASPASDAGVVFNATTDEIEIRGNQGSQNDLTLDIGDLFVTKAAGGTQTVDMQFAKSQTADGESTRTELVIYDSLGTPIDMTLTTVLEDASAGSGTLTSYRYFLESNDDSDSDVDVATGIITFDGNGTVTGGAVQNFTVNRGATSAFSPLQVSIDFSGLVGLDNGNGSKISLGHQDGSAAGTLTSFAIDENGIINGVFDNGILRNLGQVALATFSNAQGLIEAGNTTFQEGVSSGTPTFTSAGTSGAGTIRSGSVELSNTDIGEGLVDLITASTNYRGNARVISSIQQLVDELLVLGR